MTRARNVLLAACLAAGASVATGLPASAATNAQDRAWLVAAHQGNLSEIAAGTAAQQQATSGTVKDLGQMFITDHRALDAQLRQLAGRLNVSLPGAPSPAQQASLAAVKAKSGAAFDSAWISQQLASHLQSLQAGKLELAGGSDASVLAAARAAAPVVQRHYAELQQAGGGSPTGVSSGTGGQEARSPVTPVSVGLTGAGLALLIGSGVGYARRRRSTA